MFNKMKYLDYLKDVSKYKCTLHKQKQIEFLRHMIPARSARLQVNFPNFIFFLKYQKYTSDLQTIMLNSTTVKYNNSISMKVAITMNFVKVNIANENFYCSNSNWKYVRVRLFHTHVSQFCTMYLLLKLKFLLKTFTQRKELSREQSACVIARVISFPRAWSFLILNGKRRAVLQAEIEM